MEEGNSKKTRSDFSTDSEWYTYMITHPEEFEENDLEDEEDSKPKYPLIIVQCIKCGYIIDENEQNPLPDTNIEYEKRLKCPKCGGRKFKYIKSKEEKEKIIQSQKYKEKKKKEQDKRFIKATLDKIKDELKELREELEEKLKNGDITPERFSALMINLTYNIYKYYRYDDRMELFFSEFREYANNTSKNILKQYYEEHELDEKLDTILAEYNEVKEFDIIYLNHSLDYAKESETISQTSDIVVNESEVKADINRLEYEIESQEKYNEQVKELLEKEKEKAIEKEDNSLFKELKRRI